MIRAELVWARYIKGPGETKRYLLVYLGEKGSKTVALRADEVPDDEIETLRLNLPSLRAMSMEDAIKFVKDNMPVSYSRAYSEFTTNNFTVERSYGLRKLGTRQK